MTAFSKSNVWLHRFALLTAVATLGLIAIGGLVTSKGVGMAVPDWPTSYGYNMFALPVSMWFTGGVFEEHTHRQWASIVGVLVVILTRWLGGKQSRKPLLIIGTVELITGLALFQLGKDWRGAGGFLSGIGGVVFLAGIVWVKNSPAEKPLPALGWWAFWLVQLQGLLGGLRVVLDAHVFAGAKMGMVFGLFHGCLAQGFLVVLCVIALFTCKWWKRENSQHPMLPASLRRLVLFTTIVIFIQLIIGATMRHQHAGLAIPDFPLAYGKLWPSTSADAVMRYNQQRMEVTAIDPITSFQIVLQMTHRIMALVILICVSTAAWRVMRWNAEHRLGKDTSDANTPRRCLALQLRRLTFIWLALILVQASLGAWTVWSDKAADISTLHVVVGALSLVTGAMLCIIIFSGHQTNQSSRKFFLPTDAPVNN